MLFFYSRIESLTFIIVQYSVKTRSLRVRFLNHFYKRTIKGVNEGHKFYELIEYNFLNATKNFYRYEIIHKSLFYQLKQTYSNSYFLVKI